MATKEAKKGVKEEKKKDSSVDMNGTTPSTVSQNTGKKRMFFALTTLGSAVVVAFLAAISYRMKDIIPQYFPDIHDWYYNICEDRHVNCPAWAKTGECDLNPNYMMKMCRKSCKVCHSATTTTTTTTTTIKTETVDEEDDDQDVYEEEEEEEESYDDDDEDDDNIAAAPRMLSSEEVVEGDFDQNDDDDSCTDSEDQCASWAQAGECKNNPGYMLANCKKSCKVCSAFCGDTFENCGELDDDCESENMQNNCKRTCGKCTGCSDGHPDCSFWASAGECETNPDYMLVHCTKSCKACVSDDEPILVGESGIVCADKHPTSECQSRVRSGECENNPGWMIVFCAKSCGKCDLLPREARCRPETFDDPDYRFESALQKKGDVTKVFKHVIENWKDTEVILQPPKGPWVVKLKNFVSDQERWRLLNLTLPHVKRSTDQGAIGSDGIQEQVVSSGRTSSNAWCMHECQDDPLVVNLTQRISDLLQIPTPNFESYQVLQYKLGQKYDSHHDSSEDDILDMAGPRIFTFFIYFSDVEEGGETFFDKLGIRVKPEMGSAILWPSVLDEDPKKIDHRTTHAALPVIKGEKLAANVWVHMRDFKTPNLWGCTGAFDE